MTQRVTYTYEEAFALYRKMEAKTEVVEKEWRKLFPNAGEFGVISADTGSIEGIVYLTEVLIARVRRLQHEIEAFEVQPGLTPSEKLEAYARELGVIEPSVPVAFDLFLESVHPGQPQRIVFVSAEVEEVTIRLPKDIHAVIDTASKEHNADLGNVLASALANVPVGAYARIAQSLERLPAA